MFLFVLVILLLALTLDVAALRRGADSRPTIFDGQNRSI
jgi:hypothetical protein